MRCLLQPDTPGTQAAGSSTAPRIHTPALLPLTPAHRERPVCSIVSPPHPLPAVCSAVPPTRSSTAFFPLAVHSPDQCLEAEWAGCPVWQKFPVLLPLPPFPLANSETKSILARGYSLTSILGVCYSQRTPLLVSASKLPPTSVQCKPGQVALQSEELGGKREQPEQNNNLSTTTLAQSISVFQAGHSTVHHPNMLWSGWNRFEQGGNIRGTSFSHSAKIKGYKPAAPPRFRRIPKSFRLGKMSKTIKSKL